HGVLKYKNPYPQRTQRAQRTAKALYSNLSFSVLSVLSVVQELLWIVARRDETIPVLTPAQCRPPRMRACSIFTQRSMTTSSPASIAIRAASSLRMPSCIHSTFAPLAIASRAIGGISLGLRKQSTRSTGPGIAATDG